MIMTSEQATPMIKAAMDSGEIISDDLAQTIASWWHSSAEVDEQITRVSHGKDFDADALYERLTALLREQDTKTDEWGAVYVFGLWAESKTRHIEVRTWRATEDEYYEAEGQFPDDVDTVRHRVAEYLDNFGEWVYPGDAKYPADTSAFEVDAKDGSVWIPGDAVTTAAHMLRGTGTQFWAQSYTGYGEPGLGDVRPHGHYESASDMHASDGKREYCEARVFGFTDAEEIEIFRAWEAL